jgi:hypothetical protein
VTGIACVPVSCDLQRLYNPASVSTMTAGKSTLLKIRSEQVLAAGDLHASAIR